MKRTLAGLIGGVVFGLMISGTAFASGDEAYEHGYGYGGYGNGYVYNDDMYEHGRARIVAPVYGTPAYSNVIPTASAVVYPSANISTYRAAVPYYGHESYEYGRYGYSDDMYEHRGYRGHD